MARTETGIQPIAPQTREAVGLDTYVQSFPDPNAGADFAGIAQALGVVSNKMAQNDAKSAATKKAANEAEYTNNLDYYANTFMHDHTNGIVDATQVGRAFPGASPIVAGKITELVGSNWGNTYARQQLDSFLGGGDAARLDPAAQRQFFDGLRTDVAKQTEGNPFYGQGAITATNSIINEYESNLQRETATYHQKLQEDDFTASVAGGLQGQPIVTGTPPASAPFAANGTPDAAAVSFLTSRLVTAGRDSDITGMQPGFSSSLAAMIQAAPPEIQAGLGVLSGTRSNERQKVLYDAALAKYGSPAEARKWVAPPGGSKHNSGEAADLSYNGKSLAHAPKAVVDWVHANADQYGLTFPLANENWHVEPKGARDGHGAAAAPHPSQGVNTSTAPTALMELVGQGESGGNYDAYSGNATNNSVKFTSMTLNDVVTWQRQTIASGATPSSAVGKYQIVRDTLLRSMKDMGLTGNEQFTPQLQDSIAMHLMKGRGYDKFVAGEMSASEFQDGLSQEWSSLPGSNGAGHYAGQNATVDGSKLRVAMSTTGPVQNSVETLDQYAGGTSSINPIRRREIIVETAIQLATANRDTAILDRIPAAMLSIPEVAAKVEASRLAITNLSFDDWNHQRTVAAYDQTQAVEAGQKEILTKLQEPGGINPADYINNPDLYQFAKQVQADERTRPAVSAANTTTLEQQLIGYGTVGIPQDTPGKDDFERMRNIIVTAPDITSADRQKLLDQIPTYLEGVNLINDGTTDAFYQNYVGNGLNAYMLSLDGSMVKMLGTNPTGQLRAIFDSTLQDAVYDSISDGHGIPRGAAKRAILKEAADASAQLLESLKSNIGNAPPTVAPPAAAPRSAADLDAQYGIN